MDETIKTVAPWVTGGLAGAILTLISKTLTERRQQKRLAVSTASTAFSLPSLSGPAGLQSGDLKVAYKGTTYDDLFLYSVEVRNTGSGSLDALKVVLLMPAAIQVLQTSVHTQPVSASAAHSTKTTPQNVEHEFALPKLERADSLSITVLAHGKEQQIECVVRGIDGVRVTQGTHDIASERESGAFSLTLYGALFVIADAIPLVGTALKAMALVAAAPTVKRMMRQSSLKP